MFVLYGKTLPEQIWLPCCSGDYSSVYQRAARYRLWKIGMWINDQLVIIAQSYLPAGENRTAENS